MKKYMIVLSLAIVGYSGLQAMMNLSWNSRQMAIAGYSAFGQDWLFKKPIDQTALMYWQNECDAGLDAITNYAKNLNKKKKKTINSYVAQLNDENYNLINNIKVTYNTMFSPAARAHMTPQMILNRKIELRPLFDTIVNNMRDLILKITLARKKTKKADELAAYNLIDQMIQAIMNVAKKAARSVDFVG